MNIDEVLNWVKNFKHSWLPKHLTNDTKLIELVSNKVQELEHILENNHRCQSDSPLVLTSLDNHPFIEEEDDEELFSRPAIRIKRISLVEAQQYLPYEWPTPKTKPRRKRGRKKLSFTSSSRKRNRKVPPKIDDEIKPEPNHPRKTTRTKKLLSPPPSNIEPIKEIKSKQKRKLRAMDNEDDDLCTLGNLSQSENLLDDCEQISRYIGQNGILSQTRRTNETTTTTTTTFDDTNDLTIKTFSTNDDLPPIFDEPSLLPFNENHPIVETNNSLLDYDACIEDITNDSIDPPAAASTLSSTQFEQLPLSI